MPNREKPSSSLALDIQAVGADVDLHALRLLGTGWFRREVVWASSLVMPSRFS
jgi:hypothetical protein